MNHGNKRLHSPTIRDLVNAEPSAVRSALRQIAAANGSPLDVLAVDLNQRRRERLRPDSTAKLNKFGGRTLLAAAVLVVAVVVWLTGVR